MLDLTSFLDPDELGSLVPPRYGRYRRAVVEGLTFFLLQLDPARIGRIHATQAALPRATAVEERLVALAREAPVLHKLAQVLARDRRLPFSLRQLFQHLETMPASAPLEEVKGWVAGELGPIERLGLHLDGPPLAEASVAIVTPFALADGGEQGVFKVLKPGIEAILAEDLDALEATGAWLDERCHELGLPEIPYEATFSDVARLLRREVRLEQEQRNLAEASAAYADVPDVVIPELHPFSSPRLTAMSRVFGRKVTEQSAVGRHDSVELARTIGDAMTARPLWSSRPNGVFHADPHAGNLMVTPDGKLAVLDWALAGVLWKHERVLLTQILIGALCLDSSRMIAAIEALSRNSPRRAALEARVRQSLQRVARGHVPGLSWLTELLDGIALEAGASFGGDLVLFRKSVLTLEGVMADVDESVRMDDVIAARLISQLMVESGPRWFAHPLSRSFGSHLSNRDLMELMLSGPLAAWRPWLRG